MSDFKPLPGQFTGRHMLIIMIAFFGVIISVNLLMAVVASHAWTGLVVKNSYVASQNFNTELAAARLQKTRGWRAGLKLGQGTAHVSLTGKGSENRPLQNLIVTLKLSRPTHESEDRVFSLSETEPGHYQAPVDLNAGVWNAEINASSPSGDTFRQIHRITIDAGTGP